MLSQSFTSSGTFSWTAPADTYLVYAECWGAGGGGGGAGNDINYDGGDGGGGGAYAASYVYVNPGSSYTVFVGAGGAGGTTSLTAVGSGQSSWAINSGSVLADGGQGAGTGGTVAASIGSTRYAGGNGGAATNVGLTNVRGGGGGGGAGKTAAGSNAGTAPTPGAGGSGNPGSGLGAGGSGSATVPGNGSVGRSAGGGGGGATTNNLPASTFRSGGSGSDGYVILTWNDQVNYPVTTTNGTLNVMGSASVVNPAFFPISRSVAATSSSFSTLLPDPYIFQTSSTNVSTNVEGTKQNVFTFSVPTRIEKQYYINEAILAGETNLTSTGPRISVSRSNSSDGFFSSRSATSLTAVAVLNQGSADAEATASMTTAVAANVPVPISIRGIFLNSTATGSFSNTVRVDTSAGVSVTIKSGSMFYNHFTGLSSSLTPLTSSQSPIALVSGTLDSITGGSTINPAVLPPIFSYWTTASLTTTVTNSSNTTWATVFTLTNMTNGKRYLVNYFLKCESAATTTGVWLRVASGSNYTGLLYSLSSGNNNPPSIASSSGSAQIINRIPSGIPSANSTRLFWGEYTVTKAAGLNPTIEIQSEVNTSQVLAQSGSLVMWRPLE